MKKLLFNINKLPYSSLAREEEIETILFAASFGYHLTVLFSACGVLQLNSLQQPLLGQKNIGKMISGFPNFDIDQIYVCAEDLAQYAFSHEDLVVRAQLISRNNIMKLIQQADITISY